MTKIETFADATHQESTKPVSTERSRESLELVGDYELNQKQLQQLDAFNPKKQQSVDICVQDVFQQQALRHPAREAVAAWNGQFSFSTLDHLSSRLASHLRRLGVGLDEFVPVCSEKSRWYPVALLGVLKAGAAFVPLDPSQPSQRLEEILCAVTPNVIIATTATAEKANFRGTMIIIDDDDERAVWRNSTPESPALKVPCTQAAYTVFTSGTSGKPKGVVIEHRSLSTSVLANSAALNIHERSRVFQFASHAFDASLLDIFAPLVKGGCVCIPSEIQRKNNIAEACRRLGCTWAFLTPSLTRVLEPQDLCTLETLIIGGEALREGDVEKWMPHMQCISGYGPTECTIGCMATILQPGVQVDPANLGRGVGVNCWVVDPGDHNRLTPPGEVGELLLEGPMVARGYLNNPERTTEVFIDPPSWHRRFRPQGDRMYKTGDLVVFDAVRNSIRYIGRKDMQVKLHGQRLDTREVEHHIRLHTPDAMDVVVDMIPIADESASVLIAFLVLKSNRTQSPANPTKWLQEPTEDLNIKTEILQRKLSKVVPQYMVPRTFLFLVSMPLTNNGKSDRQTLRRLAATLSRHDLRRYSRMSDTTSSKSCSPVERKLQSLWSRVLNVRQDDIGLQDSFFGLGGTSVAAMKLAGLARKEGIRLDIADLYGHPTLRDMVIRVRAISANNKTQPFSLIPTYEDRAQLLELVMQQCVLHHQTEIEDVYPCTSLQEGLISLAAKRPGSYTGVFRYELPRNVNSHQFRNAWNALVEAHPILRTRFIQGSNGKIYQAVVRGTIELEVSSFDDEPNNILACELGKPWIRAHLHEASAVQLPTFTLIVHHALSDGWGLPVLLRELEAAYNGQTLNERPFSPFIEYISRTKVERENYWKGRFTDVQSASFPQLPSPAYVPESTLMIPIQISIRQTIQSEYTLPEKLKLAWAVLLSYYTETSDVVFGLTVSGRGAPVIGVEDMAGPAIATIPLRLNLDPGMTVKRNLQQLREYCISAIPYEQIGLQNLRRLGEGAAKVCNFQSHIVVQPEECGSDWMFSRKQNQSAIGAFSSYAITLICQQQPGTINIEATFDPHVVSHVDMDRMLKQLRHLMIILTSGSEDVPLRDLDAISPEDGLQLEKWNRAVPETVEICAHDWIRKRGLTQPNAPAVCAWDGNFTYAEMEQMSSEMARYLQGQGVGPKVFIPLYFEKSRWTPIAMLAVIKAGGAFIVLDDSHPTQRLRGICDDAEAPFIITSEKNASSASQLADVSIVLGESHCSWPSSQITSPTLESKTNPKNPLYAVFTSGSTGKPKGAIISHESWCTSAKANSVALSLYPTSRVFQFAAYAFDISIADHLLTLVAGGCICIPSAKDREGDLARVMRDLEVNWACLTPSVARIIQPQTTPMLKTLVLAGEPIAPEDITMWSPEVHLLNLYGPAECAILTTLNQNVNDPKDPNNVGLPTSAVCWVVDAHDDQKLMPIGSVGELVVESPIVGYGYINNPTKTAASFIAPDTHPAWLQRFRRAETTRSRLYRTGDLVQYKADGTLRFVGRKDTQIKLRGQRIELGEVEYHLRRSFPDAAEAVAELVVPKDDTFNSRRQPTLTAFIRPRDQTLRQSDRTLQAQVAAALPTLRASLPSYMIPTAFLYVNSFPLSTSRKLDRKLLRSLAAERPREEYLDASSSVQKRDPSSPVEHVLHELFEDTLNVDGTDFGVDHDFFALGGDSILAMSLVARARSRGLDFRVRDLFANPTVCALAQHAKCDGKPESIET
ncbi:acetyl-CoA synthetase-like protein [Aspergillus ibericus CBS 121593]|uniref:Acetyl-CoA synthetase-like protein n=1 Tax=Aspergillus ibericus CBS 121593 TaxID=1448316 RepID=A0A395H408_9EURO|nr:acetyl-CoA synthetase-like protein [Aspergillus ibericus CBS 121593]RAL02612.1 acetyl-CoA synthetase-like protein [Aspergillus ibericus CBS 121593]